MLRSPFARLSVACPLLVLAIATGAAAAAPALAQSASVDAPGSVRTGAEFQVTWSGPSNQGDFVSLDPAGSPDRSYGPYVYTREGSPVTLRAPGEPGDYEVRYHSGESGYAVLAAAPVTVTAAEATVDAPATAAVGEEIQVSWSGPDGQGDFVSIDPAGAPERSYGDYQYTREGSPLTLTAPSEPGDYEVRYHLGVSGYGVVASAPLQVTEVQATLEIPASVKASSDVTIQWQGPDNPRDFVSIDELGATDSSYGRYEYTSEGSPIVLPAPDAPGEYLVRYHLGSSGYRVIGQATLTVGGTEATVAVSGPVPAGEPFEVTWTGPDNELDFVTIVPVGTPEKQYGPYAYTRRGNPVRVLAPDEPGDYEVRYATGRSYLTLAAVPVTVTPGDATGTLRVIGGAGSQGDAVSSALASGDGAVELILDASGSMLQRLDGTRRIDLAKAALEDLVGDTLPAGTPFALRVFGHRQADSCRTDLEIPLAPLDRGAALGKIRSIEAKNLAKTPIADSLRQVGSDLASASGPRLVVLVTDGEETCDGDPEAAIRALRATGVEVRVDIVGFAIDELMLEEDFRRWAELGGGRYVDARDGEALRRAVAGSVRQAYEVLDGDGTAVATGVVDGEAVELPVGRYRVRLVGSDDIAGTLEVTAGAEASLSVDG